MAVGPRLSGHPRCLAQRRHRAWRGLSWCSTGEVRGCFEGLGSDGAMLLRLAEGTLRPLHAGEVYLRIARPGAAMMGAPRGRSELVLLPLGGIGEIGMNCYLYGIGEERSRKWIMVDLGVKFGDDRDPGIDLILPDISFIAQTPPDLLGIVLTHAHEDHIGALPWLWRRLRLRSTAPPSPPR